MFHKQTDWYSDLFRQGMLAPWSGAMPISTLILRHGSLALLASAISIFGYVSVSFGGEPNWRNHLLEIDAPRLNQLQQVQQLVESKQYSEALDLLQKIEDEGGGLLIEASRLPDTAPFPVARYIPLADYCHAWRLSWSKRSPDALAEYRSRVDASANKAWEEVQRTNQVEEGRRWLRRYSGASATEDVLLWLGDLLLDRGEVQAARECFQRIAPGARLSYEVPADGLAWQPRSGSVAVSRLLSELEGNQQGLDQLMTMLKSPDTTAPLGSVALIKRSPAEIWARLVWCSVLEGDTQRASRELQVLQALYPDAKMQLATGKQGRTWAEQAFLWIQEDSAVQEVADVKDWSQFAGNSQRNLQVKNALSSGEARPLDWPRWAHSWLRVSATTDRNPAGLPRVSEDSEAILAYHPVAVNGRVYVNDLRRIYAFDLQTGNTWPSVDPKLPLYDSGLPEESLIPLAYPICGVPRATLAVDGNQLFARMGVTVSAWKETPQDATTSLSFLIGLDLDREGRMLEGFPIYLSGAEWKNCEFDGSPLPVGNRLLVCVTERNSVQLRRFIAAFDRYNGKLLWRSLPLVAGSVEGSSDANLISQQLLSYSNGTAFLSTGLGVIAAVDVADGQLKWLTRYARSQSDDSAYPVSQRFRYRDLTPCIIQRDTVLCAPPDSPEIFALDAGTGDLLWSTVPEHSADLVHLVCADDESLIAAGDRLAWFDVSSGKMLASFPPGMAARPEKGVS